MKDIWKPLETILHMKVKDLIELLEEENPKSKVYLEFETLELEIDECTLESSDGVLTIKFIEK